MLQSAYFLQAEQFLHMQSMELLAALIALLQIHPKVPLRVLFCLTTKHISMMPMSAQYACGAINILCTMAKL